MCNLGLKINSVEENFKSMTPYMINFVVIIDIIWLKAFSCNGWITHDKKLLNVWHDNFHPMVIKDKS